MVLFLRDHIYQESLIISRREPVFGIFAKGRLPQNAYRKGWKCALWIGRSG